MLKKLLLFMMLCVSAVGAWAQYGITYNGVSATITETSPGQSLEAIISDINTSHSDVVNFSLPSTWTKEQVNTFAQGVTNKKSISKDTYGTVDVWSYIDPKTSASTNYSGTIYAGSEIGKSGENYGKLNSYSVVPTAENISYVKSGTTDVYTVSATTPVLYQGGNEYGVEEGNLIDLYVAYMNGSEKYIGTLMALEGGNAYGNTGNAVEVTTANVPYTYNAGGFDYVYLGGDVYNSAGKKYYLPTAGDIVGLTISTIYKTYSTSETAVVFSGTEDDIDLEHMYDPWDDGILCYYAKNDEGHTVPIYPVSSYTYGDGVKYTGVIYEKEGAKYGYTGSDAHELTAVNTSLTYETSTNKVYSGRLYKDASDNTVGADGADIALTTERFSDEACTEVYTGPATEDNSKGGIDSFELSKSYTYTYSDLTGTEHTSDPFASHQAQINLSGDELYIEVANNPIPAKTSSELIVYTTAEGELQALIDAMTSEEKAAVKTIKINGKISYADATSLSNLTSAKVFDVVNATGSLGSINVSGVVIASNAADIAIRNNLTAVVTPVDATTVDMVKGSASTIDAEALEMALAGKQTVNIKNPDANSTIVNTSLIDKLPSNITKVSIADNTFGGSQANIAVSNTNITEFDASNVKGAYGKLTLNLSACTGLTTVNLLNSLLPEDANVIGTLSLPKPLTVMCTAAEKAQVKKLLSGDDSNITYVVPAVKLAVSIADGLTVNHDKIIELSVIESAITVEATGYDALVKGTDYSLVVKQNGTAVTAAGLDASTFDDGEHSVTSIPFTVEVTSLKPTLYTNADVANGSIALTHKKSFTLALSFEGSKTSINANSSETAQINATSKDTESEAAINVEYTYRSSDESLATVSPSGLVTAVRGSSDPVTFTVTATPTGDDAANYAPMTETISINVTQSWVTLSKETIDDKEFVVVNVPLGGAFGPISDEPTTIVENGATLADLKAAANVKVTGLLANSDVQELVNLIGSYVQNVSDYANCETLDMGDATMTEEVTSAGYKCSWVNTSNSKSLGSVKDLTLPKPAPGYTVLPSYTMSLVTSWNTNSKNSLQTLTIPEGWTETAAVFSCFQNTGETTFGENNETGKTGLTTLNLPNSLEKIGNYSFADICVQTLYMPKNIKYIGAFAFSPTSKMQDIYFTGDGSDLKYVDRNAFSSQTQLCNNSVNDQAQNGKHMPTINRGNYVNGNVPVCIMHYPKGCDAEYTDVTRSYIVLDTSGNGTGEYAFECYTKGGNTYTPKGEYDNGDGTTTSWQWDEEFKTLINSKVYSTSWSMSGTVIDGAFPDDTYGYSFIWPSQSQMTYGYAIANAGYLWNMQPMSTAQLDYSDPENPVDKRGLYQFIIGMGNAPSDKDKWIFQTDYEKDLWYTFSVPFDMSIEDIKNVFGEGTQVCRISKVIRDDSVDPKVLKLEFRKSVMDESDGRLIDYTYSDGETQSGIRHHWPYMIRPGGKAKDNTAQFYEDGHRVLPDYETIPGNLMIETVKAVKNDRETETQLEYMFCPILMQGKIKKNSYVLANKNGVHQFVFYRGAKVKDEYGNSVMKDGKYVYEDGGTASANTAYVQLIHGQDDGDTYFPTGTISTGTAKVSYASFFGLDIDEDYNQGVATDVMKLEIVCGNDDAEDDKVYTISGVLTNGKSLAPGLYIKNGKKFIVK